jgi:hypothetical protein
MGIRTDCSNFLNSSSLDFLYSSISLPASARASLRRCTRSVHEGARVLACHIWSRYIFKRKVVGAKRVVGEGQEERDEEEDIHWRACCTILAASFSASSRVWIPWDCCAAYIQKLAHHTALYDKQSRVLP